MATTSTRSMTPLQFMQRYKNLSVMAGEEMENGEFSYESFEGIKLNKYMMAQWRNQKFKNSTDPSKQAKYKKFERFKEKYVVWMNALRKYDRLAEVADPAQADTAIMMAFNGKGKPEDYELVLDAVTFAGAVQDTRSAIQYFCDNHLGLDCSGFVNAYFQMRGNLKVRQQKTIADYFTRRRGLRKSLTEVQQGDVLIWIKNGKIKNDPGHIALVESCSPGSNRIHVVESTGTLGLCESQYTVRQTRVTKVPRGSSTINVTEFKVFRPKKGFTEWVRIVKPF